MLAFLLSPRRAGADDPDWAWSTYRGPCMVIAESEELARRYAAGAFVLALASQFVDAASTPAAAWLQERLVSARPAPPAVAGSTLPAGGVIAPGHDCPTLRLGAGVTG